MIHTVYKKITVYGIVQGVGFRPFVKRLADELGIKGTVSNRGSYVAIEVTGDEAIVEEFVEKIKLDAPDRAMIQRVEIAESEEIQYSDFSIITSAHESGEIMIPADIAICDKCKRELFDESNRRYHHPFINCTDCGPRLTILESMPYDRERTTMKVFAMCPECGEEYYNPTSRRFDAQPVCCPKCGPRLHSDYDGDSEEALSHDTDLKKIKETAKIITDGGIVAIKGIGGFHLSCDAKNEKAIATLRLRKTRPYKPLAIMCADFETVKKYCAIDHIEATVRGILDSPEKPILLLPKRGELIPESIAPFNNQVGVMLPYTPLHLLIFKELDTDVLVMTSGNRAGSPIARNDDEAKALLGDLCDYVLSNNRDILIRADDSVMELDAENKPVMIRRSRGYAPLPIIYKCKATEGKVVLSMGGELKNSFCVSIGDHHYMSPYIGDMSNYETVKAARETCLRFLELLECTPDEIVIDMHPNYLSSKLGQELAAQFNCSVRKVQHHYAHIMSCIAENGIDIEKESVIGLSCDGTGYGEDGTIWGSEIVIVESSDGADDSEFSVKRIDSLESFSLIGGDSASRSPYKCAVSLLLEKYDENTARCMAIEKRLCDERQFDTLLAMKKNNINVIKSSSLGRIFDAHAALFGLCLESSFEGEGAVRLQYAAESGNEEAYDFHVKISKSLAEKCIEARNIYGINSVALSGGCFVNTLLLTLTKTELERADFKVYIHSLVPPNDGGLALGQAILK